MLSASPSTFAFPLLSELWWVAVENAVDPSGGWLVLADPDEAGARQIQEAFAIAGVAIMAAVDCRSLCSVFADPSFQGPFPKLPTVRDLADVCLPKRWTRAMGLPHPGEIDQVMAAQWRAPANSLAQVPGQETDRACSRPPAGQTQPQPPEPARRRSCMPVLG